MSGQTYNISKTQRDKVKQLCRMFKDYEAQELYTYKPEKIEAFSVNKIFNVLDQVRMWVPGRVVAFRPAETNCPTFVMPERVMTSAISDPCPTFFYHVPFTAIGIWQAFLLKNIWRYALPLYWHAGYDALEFYLEEQTIDISQMENFARHNTCEKFEIKKEHLPSVTLYEDECKAEIKIYAWSEWGGLMECNYTAIYDDGIVTFCQPKIKTIVHYDCGILF